MRKKAFETLKKLTSESQGYEPDADENKRTECIKKWTSWWDKNKDKLKWSSEKSMFIIIDNKKENKGKSDDF